MQRQFDFKRATKLNTLERVLAPAAIKSLLKTLDSFARDDTYCTVTLNRISVSMGCSPSSARRAIRLADKEGLLTVKGDQSDGCARTYGINWIAVFDLPDGVAPKRRRRPVDDTSEPLPNQHPTPVNLVGVPYQNWKGSPTTGDRGPLPTLVGVSCTDSFDQLTDAVRQANSQPVGVVGLREEPKPRLAWCDWTVDTNFPKEERQRLLKAGIQAGHLTISSVDRVRLLACCLQAKTRPADRQSGWCLTRIENGDWGYLDAKYVKMAMERLRSGGIVLTREESEQVRVNRMVRGA